MVALPTIIGMGIDNGVHLYHRSREEGANSMPLILRSTGGAMMVSMLTTMVGFFGLMMATHPGLNSIGRLALIGLLTCFVTAVVVLPALLQVLEDILTRGQEEGYDGAQASGQTAQAQAVD
jgi:hypothetical protein